MKKIPSVRLFIKISYGIRKKIRVPPATQHDILTDLIGARDCIFIKYTYESTMRGCPWS
jgi:hypothetical protein